MNACKAKTRELLPEFVHGLLSPEKMVRIAEHMEDCEECAAEVLVLRQLENESIPEPPPWFWNTLPGKVTVEAEARRKRKKRILIPVWAGGLATAAIAMIVLLQSGPAPQFQTDVSEYTVVVSSVTSYLGLEEEILSVSGVVMDDLEKPLFADLGTFSEEYIDGMDLILEGDGYETMDENTLEVFENILERMTPERVRKKVTS